MFLENARSRIVATTVAALAVLAAGCASMAPQTGIAVGTIKDELPGWNARQSGDDDMVTFTNSETHAVVNVAVRPTNGRSLTEIAEQDLQRGQAICPKGNAAGNAEGSIIRGLPDFYLAMCGTWAPGDNERMLEEFVKIRNFAEAHRVVLEVY